MMRDERAFSPVYWLIPFLLAAFFRFVMLGHVPLDDREATLALQALDVARGVHPILLPEIGYILPTSGLFWLLTAANWTARLWPALAGFSLVAVPWALRRDLGERVAFFLALGLAIDPFINAAAHRADGAILAAAGLLWGLVAVRKGHYFWAGAALALVLSAGVSLWLLVLALFLTLLLLLSFAAEQVVMTWDMLRYLGQMSSRRLRAVWLGAGAVWLGAVLIQPRALAVWLGALPAFFRNWTQPSRLPPLLFVLGGLTYGLLPFGLALAERVWHRRLARRDFFAAALAVFAAMAAFLVIFYPAHQPSDWMWVSLALWPLAARFLAESLSWPQTKILSRIGVSLLTMALLGFEWLQMEAVLFKFFGAAQALSLPWGLSLSVSEQGVQFIVWWVGWLILLVSLSLVAMTWGDDVAAHGFYWGALFFFVIYTLGMAWSPLNTRYPSGVEFWQAESKITGAETLSDVLAQITTWQSHDTQVLPLALLGVDWPSLRWVLRDYAVESITVLDLDAPPAFVITPEETDFSATQTYRGQPLRWRERPVWYQQNLLSWARWVMQRPVTQYPENLILWVRADLFPDKPISP